MTFGEIFYWNKSAVWNTCPSGDQREAPGAEVGSGQKEIRVPLTEERVRTEKKELKGPIFVNESFTSLVIAK